MHPHSGYCYCAAAPSLNSPYFLSKVSLPKNDLAGVDESEVEGDSALLRTCAAQVCKEAGLGSYRVPDDVIDEMYVRLRKCVYLLYSLCAPDEVSASEFTCACEIFAYSFGYKHYVLATNFFSAAPCTEPVSCTTSRRWWEGLQRKRRLSSSRTSSCPCATRSSTTEPPAAWIPSAAR